MSSPTLPTETPAASGLWVLLSRLFRVPLTPPELPRRDGEFYTAFKPSHGFLNYLRVQFIVGLVAAGLFMLFGVGFFSITTYLATIIGLPFAIAIEVISGIIGFTAIHLRYDTTWYVLGERSLRLRRGVWVIHETTITFENIQNVRITQGPLQRLFGISNLIVETAGGGKITADGKSEGHTGLIEGVAHADKIRDMILAQTAKRKGVAAGAGLGDEEPVVEKPIAGWQRDQVELLGEIRELIYSL